MADVPDQQAHRVLGWSPPSGNLMIAGLPGSGVTGAVATVAVSLARSATPAAVHLYVIAADVARLAPLADLPHCGGVIGVDDHERIARVLRVIDAALRTRRAGSHTAGQHPAIVLLVDGTGALRAELEQPVHIDQLDVLERVAADGPGLGVHIVLGAEHPGAVGHRLERTVTQRVLLRLPDRGDYLHAGLRAVDPSALPPGRGFDASTGHEVQIALAAHDGLAAAVARVADHLGELGCRRATVTRIGPLPSSITVSALAAGAHVAHGCIRVPIGTGDHDLCPIHLELRPGDHALIAGPARAGKTTALRTIAAQLRALDTVRVLTVASARTGIRPTRPELEELVASVLDDDMPAVVLVDDADLLDEFGLFTSLVLPGRPHLHVVATGRGDRLRGLFRHWTAELRRAQLGVLLRPDEVDGDLLGARLPRLSIAPRVAGRGYLIRDGEHELCQIAVATPDDAGEADDACDASDACDAGDRGDARCA
jgi:S-DNA-T family DNA segregation ATPase FtsK/SpoIIIE